VKWKDIRQEGKKIETIDVTVEEDVEPFLNALKILKVKVISYLGVPKGMKISKEYLKANNVKIFVYLKP